MTKAKDQQIAKLTAQVAAWRKAFEHIEWDDFGDVKSRKECHVCGAFEEDGHREDCLFADPSTALDG